MKKIEDIAKQLKDEITNIVCVYAFNSTGKTRLSVAYKDITKDENGNHAGMYYNAYSEDLFDWDNDEENNNNDIRLNIKESSLNKHHSLLEEDFIRRELSAFKPGYEFKFSLYADTQRGISSISFSLKEKVDTNEPVSKKPEPTETKKEDKNDAPPIKISRSEERIFIWCFFLALFKRADEHNAHFFIDDPVSSLDENNIFFIADTIMQLVEDNFNKKKKIILTTHHIGLFNILYDCLKRGEKSDRYKENSKSFMLKRKGTNGFELKEFKKEVFLFHLHLIQELDKARRKLFVYHFVLLRQLLENIASFLGTGQVSHVLKKIQVEEPNRAMNMLNSLSHQKIYTLQINEMNDEQKKVFNDIFNKLREKYHFQFKPK